MQQRLLWLVFFIFLGLILGSCGRDKLPPGVKFYETSIGFITIDWSPDSTQLVGASPVLPTDGINLGQQSSEIYVWEPDSDSYQQISDQQFSNWNSDPVWHPQLEQILFYSQAEFGSDYKLGIVNINSLRKQGLTKFGIPMDWLPNGSEFVVSNSGELFIVDLASRNYETVWKAPRGHQIRDLAVSPDGEHIAIFSSAESTPISIWLISIDDNSEQVIFTSELFLQGLSWSSDGQWLISVRRAGHDDVIAIKSDGSCVTSGLAIEEVIADVSWSPDGQQIAASIYTEKPGIFFFATNSQFIQNWLRSGTCT